MEKEARREAAEAEETVVAGKRWGKTGRAMADSSMRRSGAVCRNGLAVWRAVGKAPKLQLMDVQLERE